MCIVTVLGPPEFDQYAAACYSCNWAGPDRWERIDASNDAREHQKATASPSYLPEEGDR